MMISRSELTSFCLKVHRAKSRVSLGTRTHQNWGSWPGEVLAKYGTSSRDMGRESGQLFIFLIQNSHSLLPILRNGSEKIIFRGVK